MNDYGWLFTAIGVLIAAFIAWLRKFVTAPPLPPVLNLNINKGSYNLGETALITGNLSQSGQAIPLKDVEMAVVPPSGDSYVLVATTNELGEFQTTWQIVEPLGAWKLAASYAGASTVERPFTRSTAMVYPIA